MFKRFFGSVLVVVMVLLVGCSGSAVDNFSYSSETNEEYLEIIENEFIKTEDNNKVNVSLDSSTAAYSNIRRMIENGMDIPHDAVNIEQMINYFDYSYVNDTNEALACFTEVASCPWNEENMLLQVAIKAQDFEITAEIKNNFVFLLDVSGSMQSDNKLPLMIEAFKLLIDNLKEDDRISIVTYAGSDQILLSGGFGYEKTKISAIISDLEANGSTHGSKGIETAYELASKYYIEGGNNRVFLATDGDFNVGISSISGLEKFISEKREKGIYLSAFGFGDGNLKSSKMDTLASKGNGNYYYIDSILEAKKVFVKELGGTLNTVAKDCKAQIEFNKDYISSYRLIGYENKTMSDDEFENNETDAGEIGASHTTVCLIEIKVNSDFTNQELLKCVLRYKDPTNDLNKEVVTICKKITNDPSADFIFASRVCEFALLLRDSTYKGDSNFEDITDSISKDNFLEDPYKKEFYELVLKYMDQK